MMTPTEMNASQKASVAQWFDMADKALDEAAKLMDLNLGVCRETMEDMAHCCQSACDVRDLQSAFNWQTRAFKPFVERSAEYGARLIGLRGALFEKILEIVAGGEDVGLAVDQQAAH